MENITIGTYKNKWFAVWVQEAQRQECMNVGSTTFILIRLFD